MVEHVGPYPVLRSREYWADLHRRRTEAKAARAKPFTFDEAIGQSGWQQDAVQTFAVPGAAANVAADAARARARSRALNNAQRSADDKLIALLDAGPEKRRKRALRREIRKIKS